MEYTLDEVCMLLGKSKVTIKKNFGRTKENLAKKGIILERVVEGKNKLFTIEYKKRED
jgi:uncharacterized protein Veg